MSAAAGSFFRNRWSVFWATSYTFDIRMFEDFWLPRLGEPPLNATLLVDANRLSEVWEEIRVDGAGGVRSANQDYLIRGVPLGGWSFHPKTYLFADERDGALLVGSGNLGLKGLEEGHEAFSVFESGNPEDLPAIRAWRDWMWRVVRHLDDPQVSTRWVNVLGRLKWLQGPATDSAFVSNWERSMLTHLSDLITQPVDELHVLAPFFDREAVALAELVRVTNPADVHLYIGGGVSVEGVRLLEAVTREDRQVHIHGFRPSDFVHAKLVGIVRGDWGLLLGGSANISRAGLFGTVAGGTGNAEAGVLVELAPERLRELFVPEQLEIHDLDLTFLRGLVYRRPPDSPVLPLLLRSATRLDDGRIAVDFDGEAECVLYLVGEAITCPVNGKETAQPVDQSERGLLVHLADSTGTRLSNWVPVDNPRQLESWLQTRTPQTTDTPAGLEPGDLDTPVGRLLRRLNEACIFDIDQTPAAARARSAAEETDDPNFWERFLQEELRVDPRTVSYSRRGEHAGRAELDGDFFALMRLMLDRAPTRQAPHLVRGGVEQPETHHEGQRWSPSRRLQVRLFNVLERWCSALADPRLRWLAPAAPVRNYSRLLAALVECWACDYLPRERLVRLSRVLFTSFIRGDRTLGFLCALKEEERAEALATLSEADRALAAILAYSVLHFSWHDKSGSREEIFVWQSLLDPALTYGVIGVDEQTVAMLAEQIGQVIPSRDIQEFLLWAATYTDDRHWEQSVRLMLDLPKLELTADNVHPEFEVTLKVEGVGDPLSDPRLLTLVDLALQYRKAKGAVLTLPGCRLSAHLDDHVYAVLGGVMYESQKVLTRQLLESLRASAAGWGAILEAESGLGHVVA